MKTALALLLGLSFAQVACAQPNYQDAAPLSTAPAKATSGCQLEFSTESLCADYTWQNMPTEEAEGSFVLNFYSIASGGPRIAADPKMDLKVIIWMPGMGHGSSPVTVTKQSVGHYLVDRVFFSMHGNWQIRVQLKNAKAVVEEQIADVTF